MKKKLLALLLTFATLLSAVSMAAVVTAEEADETATSTNYAKDLVWNKTVGGPTPQITDNGAVMSGIKNAWDSVGVDILPALKAALGEDDAVTVRITFEVRAAFRDGAAAKSASARPLVRGTSTLGGKSDTEWTNAYLDALGGDAPYFMIANGNVMQPCNEGEISFSDEEWRKYETVLELTRKQIECSLLSEWVLCVDCIGGIDMLESFEFRGLSVCKESANEEEGTGTDTPALPKEEYDAEVWSPVEINLQSTVSYGNPYLETEIDATFTHTDGTKITLPGFWKEGSTWAVRFSPTKEGDWTFKVTCKDTANTGLFAEGVIHASAAEKDTALSRHGFVTIEKGQRYYSHADGTPFFWLGDTNWQAFSNVSTTVCNYPGCDCGSQFKHIVDDRVAKGFTVYQTYFVAEAGNGERSVWLDARHERPDTNVYNQKVDEMFAYLHEQGMVIALGLGCHTQTPGGMELDDFLRFTRYIVARYGCYSIVWISGQEINIEGNGKTPGYTSFDYYMTASALIEELDGYGHPNSAHMYPITADHADGQRLDTAPWHDSWTVQGGHCSVRPKDYYQSYYLANGSGYVKPFVESEANYEDINCGGFTGYDLNRMSAWSAMLCGSAGFTYGTTGIWAGCFSTSTFTGWYGETSSFSYEPWYMGLDKPGSFEMTYMKQFFEDIGCWQELVPCFSDRSKGTTLNLDTVVMAATEDASVVVTYFFGKHRSGKIKLLDPEQVYDVYWFNPRTGKYISLEKGLRAQDGIYAVTERPDENDWVLLMTSRGLAEHYEEELPKDLNPTYAQVTPTGSKVTPVSVKAVGGISYSGSKKDSQTMTDPTLWLYDGDPSTVWKPVANRATQTFLFDLGSPQKLTHITITPASGTIIPTFRVEGSNDGKIWTVITDTSVRDVENPGAGSEPLEGTYRYVKVLLRNADSVNVGEDKLDTLPYKAVYNPMSWNCYSVTEITDVIIYSDGEGQPTPEKLVAASTPGNETETGTMPAETEAPAPETQGTTDTEPNATAPKRGCSSVLTVGVASVAIALAGAVLILRKKEE